VTAMVPYFNRHALPIATKTRDNAAVIVSSALFQTLFLRGETQTSSSYAQPVPALSTRSEPPMAIEPSTSTASTAEAVLELRRLSGLTWEELAGVFDVSRRAVHHWASGNAMSAEHIQHLYLALHLVRRLNRGSSAEVRAKLLAPSATGETGLERLSTIDGANADRTLAALSLLETAPHALHHAESEEPSLIAALSTLEDRPVRSARRSRIAKPLPTRKANDRA
jgi:transcriptional regulator with XRE-family HTH domain